MKVQYNEWTIVVGRQVDEVWRKLRNPPFPDYYAVATRVVSPGKVYGFNVEAWTAEDALLSAKERINEKTP